MLASQIKHSLHKSWCGQADVGLLLWAAAYRQRRYIKPYRAVFFDLMLKILGYIH